MKKGFSIFMALLLLLISLAACGGEEGKGNETSGSASSGTASETQSGEPERSFDTLEKKNFDGKEFFILTRSAADTVIWKPIDWDNDAGDGDAIEVAVYNRNRLVEDRFTCTITQVMDASYLEAAQADYLAADSAYDIVVMPVIQQLGSMAVNGIYVDLGEMVTLSDPWWDQASNESMSLLGKTFTVMGEMNIVDNNATWAVLFNKEMAADLKMGNHYEMVNDKVWTLQKMYEGATLATDVDANRTGIAGQYEESLAFLAAADIYTVIKNADDIPELKIADTALEAVFSDIWEYMHLPDVQIFGENLPNTWGDLYANFASGNSLYCICTLGTILQAQISDMDDEFGVLPIPKMTEQQDLYISTYQPGNATGASIIVNNDAPEEAAALLEAMAAASIKEIQGTSLKEAYYETTLKRKKTQDEESMEMLDLIFENRVVDYGSLFGWTNALIMNAAKAETYSFTSGVASSQENIQATIDRIVESVKNNFENKPIG